MMIVKDQVIGILFQFRLGQLLIGMCLHKTNPFEECVIFPLQNFPMTGMHILAIPDGDAIKPDQICTIVSPKLVQVQYEHVKILQRDLGILDYHVRAVVDGDLVLVVGGLLCGFLVVGGGGFLVPLGC